MANIGFICDFILDYSYLKDNIDLYGISEEMNESDTFIAEKGTATDMWIDDDICFGNKIILKCSSVHLDVIDDARMTVYTNIEENSDKLYIFVGRDSIAVRHWVDYYLNKESDVYIFDV